MSGARITLLVPTMNRSDFLIRQLNYYRESGFQGHICIGDSSTNEHLEQAKKAIKTLQKNLKITYKEYPGVNDANVIKRLLELVSTPYAAYIADDDFLIPQALEECALFLEQHQEYSSVHGKAIMINLKSNGAYGQIKGIRPYHLATLDSEKAGQRMLDYMGKYLVTLFSVHRTESWRLMYRDVSLLADKRFASELLPCCMSVIQGKAKELDSLYLIRQDHAQRYFLPDTEKWVRSPSWLAQYDLFRDLLARELAKKAGIDFDSAEDIIEQAFDSYMVNLLGGDWRDYRGKLDMGRQRLRRFAEKIPGVLLLWRMLYSSNKSAETPLTDWLTPGSPHYDDFIPVYEAVTGRRGG